jgi:Zn-dependent protease
MIHLGSIRGTTIAIDFSFIILVGLFVATDYNPNLGIQYALLWIPVLFISVLSHELAHAAMIGAFGYGPSEIVLGGIGGATMNRRRARPWHDLVISLAGPASSFVLAWLITLLQANVAFAQRDAMLVALLPLLVRANWLWGLFNLLPISPLDGGHAVRNFFRMFLTDRTAFTVSVWIGIVVGTAVAILGLFWRWIFLAFLIAWYVFMNYQQWKAFRDRGIPGE